MFSLDKRLEKKMKCPQCGGIKFDIADDDSELAICLKCEYTNNPIDFCYDYILKLCNIEEMCKELVKNVIDYNDIDSIIERIMHTVYTKKEIDREINKKSPRGEIR